MLKTKKSKIVFSVVAVVVLIAMLIAFTMAWFSGSATNKGNQISTNQMSVKLATTDGYTGTYGANTPDDSLLKKGDGTSIGNGNTAALQAVDLGIADALAAAGFTNITDADATGNKFFTIENITPDYRMVKPLIVENYSTEEMQFQVDFKVADNKVLNDAMLFEYIQRENTGMPWIPANHSGVTVAKQGGFLFELDKAANKITGTLPAAVDANNDDVIDATEAGRAVYMVDIRLPHYAFNNYQGESTTVDVILSAGLSTSTQKLVGTAAEFAALFDTTKPAAEQANAGDTIILTSDISLAGDVTIDRPVNIDLAGNDLLTNGHDLIINLAKNSSVFDGTKTRSIMTFGNGNGGHIADTKTETPANSGTFVYTDASVTLHANNNKLCVFNWETALGTAPTVSASPNEEFLKFNQF